MSELFDKLYRINKVKDNETRLDNLRSLCVDRYILNDALEIAKHESTIHLPGAMLLTAMSALLITVFSYVLTNLIPNAMDRSGLLFILFITYFGFLWNILKRGFGRWTDLYYDLIDLRRKERRETEPIVLSKLDMIISEVDDINQKINDLEKNMTTKIEDNRKEIISIKNKRRGC